MLIDCEVKGIPLVIDNAAMDDFRMLRLLRDMQRGDAIAVYDFAERILGEEQLENVMRTMEQDGGKCSLSDMVQFVNEAVVAAAASVGGDLKN